MPRGTPPRTHFICPADAPCSKPREAGLTLKLSARAKPGQSLDVLDSFVGGAAAFLKTAVPMAELEDVRYLDRYYNGTSGVVTTTFSISKTRADTVTAAIGPKGVVSLPEPWSGLAAADWQAQPRPVRARVVKVPAGLWAADVKGILLGAKCKLTSVQPCMEPGVNLPRVSAMQVVFAATNKEFPATIKSQHLPNIMRVDLLADLPPLRPMDVAHAAGPHSFAAAAAATGPPGHGWRGPPPRQPGAATHGSQPRRSRRGRPLQGPALARAPPPPVTAAAPAPLLPALPLSEAPTPGAPALVHSGAAARAAAGAVAGANAGAATGEAPGAVIGVPTSLDDGPGDRFAIVLHRGSRRSSVSPPPHKRQATGLQPAAGFTVLADRTSMDSDHTPGGPGLDSHA